MLNTRVSCPRILPLPQRSPHYAFFLNAEEFGNIDLTVVGVSSADFDVLESTDENFGWIYPNQEIASILVELFREIPQVESICAKFGADEILVWTLLDGYDRDAREKIYGKELEICQLLRIHNFDFRVTSADLVPPEELVAAGSREIYKRR
jgi:hypothetical protein